MSETSHLLEGDASPAELANRYPHVTAELLETPWAVTEAMKGVIVTIAARRIAGEKLTPVEIAEATSGRDPHREPRIIEYSLGPRSGSGRPSSRATSGQIAVLPFYGVMAPRLSGMAAISGGTSVTSYMDQLKAAIADPDVSSILLDLDSPGGSSALIAELGQLIYDARGEKPIAAVANTMAGSAAYWVAAQADELGVTPSGSVGSIGVYGIHQDLSAALAAAGVKPTVIQAGKYKTELHPFGPLSEEALAYHQAVVNEVMDQFVEAVARGRGTTAADVLDNYGEGRMLMAKSAVKAGMADRVATFDQMVERLARGQVTAGKPSQLRSGSTKLELDDEPSPRAAAQHDTLSPAQLDRLLEGATLGALPAGADLVLKVERPLNEAEATQLHAQVSRALQGRRVVLVGEGLKLEAAEAADTDLPPSGGEPTQAGHFGDRLLQRRAVRAALRPAAAAAADEGGTQ